LVPGGKREEEEEAEGGQSELTDRSAE